MVLANVDNFSPPGKRYCVPYACPGNWYRASDYRCYRCPRGTVKLPGKSVLCKDCEREYHYMAQA